MYKVDVKAVKNFRVSNFSVTLKEVKKHLLKVKVNFWMTESSLYMLTMLDRWSLSEETGLQGEIDT